jgi:signal transduction histidine kinase/CheY-like chemotaxis protein
MKRTSKFFVWIVLFAIGLMIAILVTQINTVGLLGRLQKGNNQAALTVSINNRLQEMVNQAFELENKFISIQNKKLQPPFNKLKDSLTRLGYNANILVQTVTSSADTTTLRSLVYFIEKQVGNSFQLLEAIEQKNDTLQKNLVDSLREGHFGDSIYSKAISFQASLEENLRATLIQNNKLTSGLSSLNRVLAIVSMAAIILLATIIIRRQRKQLKLIKELDEARTQALHSANVKNQFLANMSHEIRTPLNALQGFSKLLNQTSLDKDQKRYTGIIATASDNLLNLVNDILDFSKIEAGALVIRNKIFNLPAIIHELQNMFEAQAEGKGLRLEFQSDTKLPEVLVGDAGRLRQVLFNLVSNAIKFTEAGKVQVLTKLENESDKQAEITFVVADSGVGIPQDKMDTIFERFEQLDNSLSRQHGGTGLGLAISKRLIEMMGGTIKVKSQLNVGSEFIVNIMFEKWEQQVAATNVQNTEETRENKISTEDFSSALVLVVEDNPMNQMLMEILLERMGLKFITVNNGKEALAFLDTQMPDLVLMDVQMPEMDGLETTGHLRKKTGYDLPVIAMTAHVLPGEKERCIEAGMNDYLSKPIDELKLQQMLQHYLGGYTKNNQVANPAVSPKEKGSLQLNYLSEICNNNDEKINGILKQLAEQLKTDLKDLQKANEQQDLQGLRTVCHHLKSTLSPLDEENDAPAQLVLFNNVIHRESGWETISPEGKKLEISLMKTIEQLDNHYTKE